MKIAICETVKGKPAPTDTKAFSTLTYGFKNCDQSQEELAEKINQGFAFTTQHTGGDNCNFIPGSTEEKAKHKCEKGHQGQHRRKENFLVAQHIGIDFDQ